MEKLNNYHPNIKLTIEVNPIKFFDTEIMIKNGIIETYVAVKESKIVAVKESKIPNHWSSAVPKSIKEMQFFEIYMGHIKFQVMSNLKSSVLRKIILALIFRAILFSLLLILIGKSANR